MSQHSTEKLSVADIKAEASASVQPGQKIRETVRDLTMRALKTRRLEVKEIRNVVGAVSEGINLGLEHRGSEAKTALAEALHGLDDALAITAEAMQLALKQVASKSKDFSEHELHDALENLKWLEEEFLATVGNVAESASAMIKQELQDLLSHLRRNGTDTGAKVGATLEAFSNRAQATLGDSKASGERAVREVSLRLLQLAGGIFSGLADAIQEKTGSKK
jgi:hypothetical protein